MEAGFARILGRVPSQVNATPNSHPSHLPAPPGSRSRSSPPSVPPASTLAYLFAQRPFWSVRSYVALSATQSFRYKNRLSNRCYHPRMLLSLYRARCPAHGILVVLKTLARPLLFLLFPFLS